MIQFDENTKTLVNEHLDSADKWADWFRGGNIALAVIIAGLGATIAARPDYAAFLGILTAVFGAFNKAVDPGEAAEKYTVRKRALELIKVEIERGNSNPSPLTQDQVKRLVYRSKQDPAAVLEEVITNTARQPQPYEEKKSEEVQE